MLMPHTQTKNQIEEHMTMKKLKINDITERMSITRVKRQRFSLFLIKNRMA